MVAPATNLIRVIAIDDQPLVLRCLRAGFSHFGDICLEGEALDGESGLRLIQRLQPDVAVIDIGLPQMDGLDVAAHVRETSPKTRVIVISGSMRLATISRALELGVTGFYHKLATIERLVHLIREAVDSRDSSFLSLEVPEVSDTTALTRPERETMLLLAVGSALIQTKKVRRKSENGGE